MPFLFAEFSRGSGTRCIDEAAFAYPVYLGCGSRAECPFQCCKNFEGNRSNTWWGVSRATVYERFCRIVHKQDCVVSWDFEMIVINFGNFPSTKASDEPRSLQVLYLISKPCGLPLNWSIETEWLPSSRKYAMFITFEVQLWKLLYCFLAKIYSFASFLCKILKLSAGRIYFNLSATVVDFL